MSKYFIDYNGLKRVIKKIKSWLTAKQDTLVSGTNIKTINGQSLLGSGDLSLSGLNDLDDCFATATASETEEVAASVELTDSTFKFNFGIPKGEKGDKGDKGEKGDTGEGTTPVFSVPKTVYIAQDEQPETPEGGTLDFETGAFTPPEGWSTDYDLTKSQTVWMSSAEFLSTTGKPTSKGWSTPLNISSGSGAGVDTSSHEYIYRLTTSYNSTPDTPVGEDEDGYVPDGWTDHPSGISKDYQAEWISEREKKNGTWGDFCAPALWSRWAVDGKDGDGVEYIYQRTSTYSAPAVPTDSTGSTNSAGQSFENDDYVPDGWTDNPTGVDEEYKWEWVCIRRFKRSTQAWSAFEGSASGDKYAALWSYYGGNEGERGYTEVTIYRQLEGIDDLDKFNDGGYALSETEQASPSIPSLWTTALPSYKKDYYIWYYKGYWDYKNEFPEDLSGWNGPMLMEKGEQGDAGVAPNYTVTIFKQDDEATDDNPPAAPTTDEILPAGWVDYPTSNDGIWWMCQGIVNGETGAIQHYTDSDGNDQLRWGSVLRITPLDGTAKQGKSPEMRFHLGTKDSYGTFTATDRYCGDTTEGHTEWSTQVPSLTSPKDYIWMTIATIDYTDNTEGVLTADADGYAKWSTPVYINGESSEVTATAEYYGISTTDTGITNTTEAGDTFTGWYDDYDDLVAYKPYDKEWRYLWNYEVTTYSNGYTATTQARLKFTYTFDGAGLKDMTDYYCVATVATGIDEDEDTATTDIRTKWYSSYEDAVKATAECGGNGVLDSTWKYVWNYELNTFSDGDTKRSPAHLMYTYTVDGGSITKIDNYSQLSSSASASPAVYADGDTSDVFKNYTEDIYNGWTRNATVYPTTEKPYVWQFEVIYIDNGNISVTPPQLKGNLATDGRSIVEMRNWSIAVSESSVSMQETLQAEIDALTEDEKLALAQTTEKTYTIGTHTWNRYGATTSDTNVFIYQFESILYDSDDENNSRVQILPVHYLTEKGTQGENAKYLDLDNEADILQYDRAGNLITTDGVKTTATLYDGATAVDASNVTWSYEVTSGTATVTQSTNVFTVSAMTTETAEVTIKATYGNVTYTKIFSVKKIVGTDKYELVLSDNAVRCSTDGTANPSSITIQVYRTDSSGTREDISSTLISGNGTNKYGLQVLLNQYMNDTSYTTCGQWNDSNYASAMSFSCSYIYKRYVALLQSADSTLTYDTETIPVVSDGEAGAGKTYTVSLQTLVVKCTKTDDVYKIYYTAEDKKMLLTCSDSSVTATSVVVTSGSATLGTTLTTSTQYLNNIGYSFSTSNQYILLAMNTNGTLTEHTDKIEVTWSDGTVSTHYLQVVPVAEGEDNSSDSTTLIQETRYMYGNDSYVPTLTDEQKSSVNPTSTTTIGSTEYTAAWKSKLSEVLTVANTVGKTTTFNVLYAINATLTADGTLDTNWSDPVEWVRDGKDAISSDAGQNGVTGIPGTSIEVRYVWGPTYSSDIDDKISTVSTSERYPQITYTDGSSTYTQYAAIDIDDAPNLLNGEIGKTDGYETLYFIQARIKSSYTYDSDGNIVDGVFEESLDGTWSSPVAWNGTTGNNGNNGRMIYPAGIYDQTNGEYKLTDTTAPYVYYNGAFYIYNPSDVNTVWVSSEQTSTPDTSSEWLEMESYNAIHTKILLAEYGLLGSAVFYEDWMFSQQGVWNSMWGLGSTHYERFDPVIFKSIYKSLTNTAVLYFEDDDSFGNDISTVSYVVEGTSDTSSVTVGKLFFDKTNLVLYLKDTSTSQSFVNSSNDGYEDTKFIVADGKIYKDTGSNGQYELYCDDVTTCYILCGSLVNDDSKTFVLFSYDSSSSKWVEASEDKFRPCLAINLKTGSIYTTGGYLNVNNNFIVDAEGNITVKSITTTLTSMDISENTISENDLAYRFTDSDGNVVAGFFTTGSGCQLAIKNPDDGTWSILDFNNLTSLGSTAANMLKSLTTYKTSSSSYYLATSTTITKVAQLSGTTGKTLYQFAANSTGNSAYDGKWYLSNTTTSSSGKVIPSGTAASGIYQLAQVSKTSDTYSYGSEDIEGMWYTVNLALFESGYEACTLVGQIFVPDEANATLSCVIRSMFVIDYTGDDGSEEKTWINYDEDTVITSTTLTWSGLLAAPTSYGFSWKYDITT